MSKLLTLDEAAERLRVSRRTLDRYIADGLLIKTKIRGKPLIDEIELIKLVKRSRAS
jgi:excisionase family DNA binding protein